MKILEETLGKVELKTKEAKPRLAEIPIYKGLQKVEDRMYMGPTSIKYWM